MTERSPSSTSNTTSAATQRRSTAPVATPHGVPRADPTAQVQDTAEVRKAAPDGVSGERPPVQTLRPPAVHRGLSAQLSTTQLQSSARLRALLMLNRFRVMRTIDVAVHCYPERPFKAALTAAQRCVRRMVKEQLIRRYKSDRFQTIYGITALGADWLKDHGHDGAASSVRRVSDMTNPEHRLWLQLLVVAAESRGLVAETEQELLRRLNRHVGPGQKTVQGLLSVNVRMNGRTLERTLRPDALLKEQDGSTWIEVDRSKRGAEREASLRALALSVGSPLRDGQRLRRVVVFCRNERIQGRALALLRGLAQGTQPKELVDGRRSFREVAPGTFEVLAAETVRLSDGRMLDQTVHAGHVVIQLLPTWLPKARITAGEALRCDGWMHDDYLPYRRAGTGPSAWPALTSPLLESDHGTASSLAIR